MKFKKIMLITLLLLAVLTIGAVSASDDVASDDLAVSDDGDSIESPVDDADSLSDDGDEGGEEELEDVNFWVDDSQDFSEGDYNDPFCGATIKKGLSGNISLTDGNTVFFNKALSDFADGDFEEYDENKDFNDYFISINNANKFAGIMGDTLKLSFSENDQYDFEFKVNDDNGVFSFEEMDPYEDEIYVDIWDEEDERGILYTDYGGDVVSVDIYDGSEGVIYVLVDGNVADECVIEFDEWGNFHYEWSLEDLKIDGPGKYNITVMLNDETLRNATINVVVWDENSYRVTKDGDEYNPIFILYCPDGSTGTVRVVFEMNVDDDLVEVSNETYDVISNGNMTFEVPKDLERDCDYHISITVNDEFRYGIWFHIDERFNLGIWDENDERGTLYTDYDGAVVFIDIYDGSEGKVYILVDGDVAAEWDIECEEWEDYPYKEWSLEDLKIDGPGKYNVTVMLNDETLRNATLNVVVWDENSYRVIRDDDEGDIIFLLYCPDGSTGTVRVVFEMDDDGERVVVSNETYEITSEFYDDYMDFEVPEEFERDCDYHITITVNDDEFSYGEWFYLEDEDGPEGEPIDAEFYNANMLTNDVVVRISVVDLLFADDEFEVSMDGDDPIQLNLSEIESDGDYYYIRVSDLKFSEEELDEITTIFNIYIQFYSEGEEAYYAELDDDEIYIYVSPYISSEAYFFMDDCVITFTPLENQDDEFKVTISKDGADDIVKTFKVSDFVGSDDDYPFYDITLSDLNITDAGEYHISVNFTKDGKELVFNEGNVTVGNVNIRYWEPDEEESDLTDVAGDVATIRVPDDFEGSILLDLDGNQSEIPLSDLNYNYWPSDLGRQILLNDLKITQDGVHTLKLQVYDKDGNPLLNEPLEFDISVQTGENTVEFIGNNTYGAEIGDVMDFKIGTSIPDDAYYIIYLNGKKAGNYTVRNGIVISDEFTDPFFDIDLLKVGVYKVNVTYFDGKNVTDFGQGSFTISSLDMTCDKTEYVVGNKVRVSFNAPDPNKVYYRIDAYRVDEAGPAGWNEQMLFNPYFSEDIIRDGLWKDGIITFEFEFDEAGTYYLHVTNRINPDKHGGEDEIIADIIEINVGKPIDPNLTISIADITVGESAVVKVTTNNAFSGNVTVQIANKNYTVSVVNGTGSISVPGLAAGSYTATAFFAATGMFNASTKATTFKVNDKKADEIKLALKKVKVKRSAKKLILKATLKINGKAANKKVVIFKFNKKTYKAKTNKKGVAKVKIGKKVLRKLKVGKKVKIQASYAGVVKKLTVKVKK